MIAAGGSGGIVRLWTTSNRRVQAMWAAPGWVSAIRRDGRDFVVGSSGGTLAVVDSGTLHAVRRFDGLGSIRDLATGVGPSGLVAIALADGNVAIWDMVNGGAAAERKVHSKAVTALSLSPDGGFLASVGRDGLLAISSPATLELIGAVRVAGALYDVSWDLGGERVYVCGDQGMYTFAFV